MGNFATEPKADETSGSSDTEPDEDGGSSPKRRREGEGSTEEEVPKMGNVVGGEAEASRSFHGVVGGDDCILTDTDYCSGHPDCPICKLIRASCHPDPDKKKAEKG